MSTDKGPWSEMLHGIHKRVMLATFTNPPAMFAEQFTEHPAGREVDVTEFVREEAIQARPLVLRYQGSDGEWVHEIGYFLAESAVRVVDGKPAVTLPPTRSKLERNKALLRELRGETT